MRPMYRYAITSLVMTLSATAAVAATALTPPVTGLGQTWPNTADVSSSPRFHAYRFDVQGVRYIQINDRNGTVRGAVANIGGQMLDLPIGVDAGRWSVADPAAPSSGETVYRDRSMTVRAAPQPDGTMHLLVTSECQAHPENCGNKGP